MKTLILFFALVFGSFAFSQNQERYMNGNDSGPIPSDFYLIQFEFKDFQISKENVNLIKNVNLKELLSRRYKEQDLEIYLEEIQKTIVIYSEVKSSQLMEIHYNHVSNFKPLY